MDQKFSTPLTNFIKKKHITFQPILYNGDFVRRRDNSFVYNTVSVDHQLGKDANQSSLSDKIITIVVSLSAMVVVTIIIIPVISMCRRRIHEGPKQSRNSEFIEPEIDIARDKIRRTAISEY